MTRPTEWDVTVGGHSTQGYETFPETVSHVAEAALAGHPWNVWVRGPRDSSFRPLNESEATTLIAAVTEEIIR